MCEAIALPDAGAEGLEVGVRGAHHRDVLAVLVRHRRRSTGYSILSSLKMFFCFLGDLVVPSA